MTIDGHSDIGPMPRSERKRAERMAERLGVTLGQGLRVNGHHGTGGYPDRCGSYDLWLNMDIEQVVCRGCGAYDLVKIPLDATPRTR